MLFYLVRLLLLRDQVIDSWGLMIERSSKKYADRIAIKFGEKSTSYRQLNKEANKHANFFIESGIKKSDIVCIFVENRPEFLVIFSALAKVGAIAAPINTNLRKSTLKDRLDASMATACIVSEEFLGKFQDVKDSLCSFRNVKLFYIPKEEAREAEDKGLTQGFSNLSILTQDASSENPETTKFVRLSDPVAHVSTSGTTGLPKSAIIDHKRMLMSSIWFGKISCRIGSNDTIYCPLPFYHATSLVIGWPLAVASGASIAFRQKFSVTDFFSDVHKFNATVLVYIGDLLTYLLRSNRSIDSRNHHIRFAIGNGLRREIWREFQDRFQIKKILELYVSTESQWSFTNILNIPCSVGASFQRYSIVKYDIETGMPEGWRAGDVQKVSRGHEGLLLFEVSGNYQFRGYTDERSTEQRLLRGVFCKDDVWFNTGDVMQDLGYRHARFVDRLGDTYRWKGEIVSTREVESYTNRFDQVTSSRVYGVRIPHADGRAGMVAVITRAPDVAFDRDRFYAYLTESLPRYAVPLFLRLTTSFDSTDTCKDIKTGLQTESYDLSGITDPVFVASPSEDTYVPLTQEISNKLKEGTYGF
jgi:citronellyl-CoA synthetase